MCNSCIINILLENSQKILGMMQNLEGPQILCKFKCRDLRGLLRWRTPAATVCDCCDCAIIVMTEIKSLMRKITGNELPVTYGLPFAYPQIQLHRIRR
jgi:hypothetical protein